MAGHPPLFRLTAGHEVSWPFLLVREKVPTPVTALQLGSLAGTLAASDKGGGSPIAGLLLPILLVGLVYFGFIRPQRARAKRASHTRDEIEPGREVMTTAGLYGTVAAVEDDAIVLEVAPGVRTRWARAAIAQVIPLPGADDAPVTGADDGFDPPEAPDDTRDDDDPKH